MKVYKKFDQLQIPNYASFGSVILTKWFHLKTKQERYYSKMMGFVACISLATSIALIANIFYNPYAIPVITVGMIYTGLDMWRFFKSKHQYKFALHYAKVLHARELQRKQDYLKLLGGKQ